MDRAEYEKMKADWETKLKSGPVFRINVDLPMTVIKEKEGALSMDCGGADWKFSTYGDWLRASNRGSNKKFASSDRYFRKKSGYAKRRNTQANRELNLQMCAMMT
jgi:hypothetical protein